MHIAILACGYLAACFVIAALVIRMAPRSICASQLDERLWLFAALPLLLVLDLIAITGEALPRLGSVALRGFEALSGKPLPARRVKRKQIYFSYGRGMRSARRRDADRRAPRSAWERRTGT